MDAGKDHGFHGVIIADNFLTDFGIIQKTKPSCLLPVVNCPLISYPIEFLVYNRVKKLTVFVYEHKYEISSYIHSLDIADLEINVYECSEKPSVTSVIKDMEKMNRFKNDIILVNSHIVSNIDISKAIKEHNERKAKDVPMIMTKLFTHIPLRSKLRSEKDLITVVEDSQTGQILKYETMDDKKKCNVNEFFEFKKKYHSALDVRMDLYD